MTAAWLIAAVSGGFFLIGFLAACLVYQMFRNARLEGRIQSIGAQLRHVPKRKTDKVAD